MLRKLLLLVFCLYISSTHASNNLDGICNLHDCKIIIDAGSSGTRMHLYAFDKDDNSNPVNIRELQTNKIEPGFADLRSTEISKYFDKLLASVYGNKTSVHFYATAGMRLLPKKRQQQLYVEAYKWFAKHPKWQLIEARTISGVEEGVFGWLGAYYKLGKLYQESLGFIEIGGASMQVVFPVMDYTDINSDNIVTISANGQQFKLFAHSFLGMGANKVKEQFTNNDTCFPIGFPMPNGQQGIGDALSCEHDIMSVLNVNNYISNTVKLPQQRNPASTWYTVGVVGQISQKSPLGFTNKFVTDEFFNKSNLTYCQQNWHYQQENFAVSDQYLVQNCVMTAFFNGIITDGFGIDAKQTFHTDRSIPNWTLGALFSDNIKIKHNYSQTAR